MTRIIISGSNGRMGRAVGTLAEDKSELRVVAGFDVNAVKTGSFPVYADPLEFGGTADVLIDFSSPAALPSLLSYCTAKKLPCVLCTTGYTERELLMIEAAVEQLPIFRSGNMSLGINLLMQLVKKAAAVLGSDFDIEIVERHHRMKLDAPSGTALMLAEAVSEALPYKPEYVYDRHDSREKRGQQQIGFSSVRGGTIIGEHEVIFAGPDEVMELRHTAYSRDVFANGALAAAKFMARQSVPGLYDMSSVLADAIGNG
jgi:4-hydroxy-tetrahydrodipicolinate reductase